MGYTGDVSLTILRWYVYEYRSIMFHNMSTHRDIIGEMKSVEIVETLLAV